MFRKIKNYINSSTMYKKEIKNVEEYLITGNYIIYPNLRFFYKDDKKTIKYVNNVLVKNNIHWQIEKNFKNKIKIALNSKPLKIQNDKEADFRGEIIIFKNNRVGIRDKIVIDIENKRVLTKYNNIKDMKKTIDDYNFFRDYFNIPSIVFYDYEEGITIEEFISSKPKNEWTGTDYKKVINDIFIIYENYYNSIKNNIVKTINAKYYYNKLLEDNTLKDIAYKLKNKISQELFYKNFPFVYQHGDLHLQNVMLGNDDKVYYIDWDYVVHATLFYDFLNWIQWEFTFTQDLYILREYLTGKYDLNFIKNLSIFGQRYYTNKRLDYIYIYIC